MFGFTTFTLLAIAAKLHDLHEHAAPPLKAFEPKKILRYWRYAYLLCIIEHGG